MNRCSALLPVTAEHEHVLQQAVHQEQDAQEAPADEEAHQTAQPAGQVPDVIRVELILTSRIQFLVCFVSLTGCHLASEGGCLHIEIEGC